MTGFISRKDRELTTQPDPNQRVVLHGEFATFRDSTDRSLADLKVGQDRTNESIERLAHEFRTGIRDASKATPTNWGWIIAGFGALLALMTLRIDPIADAVTDLGQRLWNVETSRYSVADGKDLRDRMEKRDDLIIAKIDENNDRAWQELVERAKWMGGADRDINENAHELDLVWRWKHDIADPMLYTQQERITDLIRRVDDIETEQRKRTDRVYGGSP